MIKKKWLIVILSAALFMIAAFGTVCVILTSRVNAHVSSIEKIGSEGLVDTYQITFSSGDTILFTVTNGAPGPTGEQGIQGIRGEPGPDGKVPVVTIQDGNWYVNGVNTLQSAEGVKGDTGRGISAIQLNESNDNSDVYKITYTDGTSSYFTVVNGKDGPQGIQGPVGPAGRVSVVTIQNGNWYIDGVDSTHSAVGLKGDAGCGISSITKTGTNGNVDTYTVTLTDGNTSTFTVTNGKDGTNGTNGGKGDKGDDGVSVAGVTIGEDGHLYVTLSNSETPVDCGAVKDVHTHSFGNWITLKDADCVSAGVRTHICSVCGIITGEETEPLGHTLPTNAPLHHATDYSHYFTVDTSSPLPGSGLDAGYDDDKTITFYGAMTADVVFLTKRVNLHMAVTSNVAGPYGVNIYHNGKLICTFTGSGSGELPPLDVNPGDTIRIECNDPSMGVKSCTVEIALYDFVHKTANCEEDVLCTECGGVVFEKTAHAYGELIAETSTTYAHYRCPGCLGYFTETYEPTTIEALTK